LSQRHSRRRKLLRLLGTILTRLKILLAILVREAQSTGIDVAVELCFAPLRLWRSSPSKSILKSSHGFELGFMADLKEIVMEIGTVKWFNGTKGFGFIQPDAGGADIFVHISAVEQAGLRGLNDGQQISYDAVRSSRTGKMAAENLKTA
jgi:CspA family cold shock protein